jgi:hypothetical protein
MRDNGEELREGEAQSWDLDLNEAVEDEVCLAKEVVTPGHSLHHERGVHEVKELAIEEEDCGVEMGEVERMEMPLIALREVREQRSGHFHETDEEMVQERGEESELGNKSLTHLSDQEVDAVRKRVRVLLRLDTLGASLETGCWGGLVTALCG